jgi:hypothetical protein
MDKSPLTSLKDKIRSITKNEHREYNHVWKTLVLERFLVRTAKCSAGKELTLKGGMLLAKRLGGGRETKDLDFLLKVKNPKIKQVKERVSHIAAKDVKDGFSFEICNVEKLAHPLTPFSGFRVNMKSEIGGERTKFHIDLGSQSHYAEEKIELPLTKTGKGSLFEASIKINAYPLELVFAEKYLTALARGEGNTRMKDFFDMNQIMQGKEKLCPKMLKKCFDITQKNSGVKLGLLPKNLKLLEDKYKSYCLKLPSRTVASGKKALGEIIMEANTFLIKSLALSREQRLRKEIKR